MLIIFLIAFIIAILFIIIIYFWIIRTPMTDQITKNSNWIDQSLQEQINFLRKENEYLKKVIVADDNIFHFIRCINIPQTPSCKTIGDGTSHICRSRLMDCNKIKLVLENNPIAVERMKVATNRYREAGQPKNPSELTNPVRSWFI